MPSVLFVCTANRFRSPIAAALFLEKLQHVDGISAWRVESAGTWGDANLPPMKEALSEAGKRNLNIQTHLSKTINDKLMQEFDLILVMEAGHKEALINEFPGAEEKVYLLSEVGGGAPYSIPDPFFSKESAGDVAAEIEDLIDKKFDLIYHWFDNSKAFLK